MSFLDKVFSSKAKLSLDEFLKQTKLFAEMSDSEFKEFLQLLGKRMDRLEILHLKGISFDKFIQKHIFAKQLFDFGFSLPELKKIGFLCADLKKDFTIFQARQAGFNGIELYSAGFLDRDLKVVGQEKEVSVGKEGRYIQEWKPVVKDFDAMKKLNIPVKELKEIGYSAWDIAKLHSLKEMREQGFKLSDFPGLVHDMSGEKYFELKKLEELKDSGFSLDEFLELGVTDLFLLRMGFSQEEIIVMRKNKK